MEEARGKITETRQEQTLFSYACCSITSTKSFANHRHRGMSASMEMIIFEARKWAVAHSVTDFAGRTFWCYSFMKRCFRNL
jgi:hypothetical protein